MSGRQPKCKRGWGIAQSKCLALGQGDVCWSAGVCPHQSCLPPHLKDDPDYQETKICPKCGELLQ